MWLRHNTYSAIAWGHRSNGAIHKSILGSVYTSTLKRSKIRELGLPKIAGSTRELGLHVNTVTETLYTDPSIDLCMTPLLRCPHAIAL